MNSITASFHDSLGQKFLTIVCELEKRFGVSLTPAFVEGDIAAGYQLRDDNVDIVIVRNFDSVLHAFEHVTEGLVIVVSIACSKICLLLKGEGNARN